MSFLFNKRQITSDAATNNFYNQNLLHKLKREQSKKEKLVQG